MPPLRYQRKASFCELMENETSVDHGKVGGTNNLALEPVVVTKLDRNKKNASIR
jgi:hypothetical protein